MNGGCNLVTPRLSRRPAQQLRQLGAKFAAILVAGQQLDRCASAGLVLEIDVGERLPVGVPDDRAPPIELGVGDPRRDQGGGKRRSGKVLSGDRTSELPAALAEVSTVPLVFPMVALRLEPLPSFSSSFSSGPRWAAGPCWTPGPQHSIPLPLQQAPPSWRPVPQAETAFDATQS